MLENCLLIGASLLLLAVLSFQLPRWGKGLDPTFVHPKWLDRSSFPFVLRLAVVHPLVWILCVSLAFRRVCGNYGWKLNTWH